MKTLHRSNARAHLSPNMVRMAKFKCSGGSRDASPLPGPTFLHFHAIFGKNWQNNRLAPPLGIPGSTTEMTQIVF